MNLTYYSSRHLRKAGHSGRNGHGSSRLDKCESRVYCEAIRRKGIEAFAETPESA